MARSIHLVREDVQPRHRGARVTHVVPMSRKGLGAFLREQMFQEGWFVSSDRIRARRTESDLPIIGHAAARDVYIDSRGRHHRGVWAWNILSTLSSVGVGTLQKLMAGEHRRSPEFFTILKVFRALRLELRATRSDDDNVDLVVSGW